jgi:type I restriction enzyme M protein
MKLTQQQLEAHLWGAANILRGKTAGQDYKNYILSLMFFKRLCDQWEHEADETIEQLEKQQGKKFTEKQKAIFRAREEHRFTIPPGSQWGDVLAVSENIGEKLTAAMRAISEANEELRGVFTVDWNQPAPTGGKKKLIPNEVVHSLIQHFNEIDLSNNSVPADVLGRAYEYLIKQFADDAGAKAGEFFTPVEVVDILVRMLEPKPGDTIYDPTCGSGGMLVHSAEFLEESGNSKNAARYFGQEMNWGNYAIGKINSVLHGLEANIQGGVSTITDPQFTKDGRLEKFSMVVANFPFSDEFWWLKPEQQTDDKKKKADLKKKTFKDGYKDSYGRFGQGTPFPAPPPGYGDYAFVLHILASLNDTGRAGIVCPQGVLFRGQPEIEEETGEFDAKGNPKIRRRKADDEHLIREALLESRLIDAIVSLPLNVFYGAGVPACLLILRKDRPTERRDQVLMIYAARHYRELSNKNELRPQDIMRILVHYHAYGDGGKVPPLVESHKDRIWKRIAKEEEEEVKRLCAEYKPFDLRRKTLDEEIAATAAELGKSRKKTEKKKVQAKIDKLEKQRKRPAAKVAERDEKIAETRRRAEDDRQAVSAVGDELVAMYADPDELIRHARVVDFEEIEENEFNLNIPRFVDTFEPEPRMEVNEAIRALKKAESKMKEADLSLKTLLDGIGYETK